MLVDVATAKRRDIMTYRGGATFAWQSDYAQFYLVDGDDPRFEAPTDITTEMTVRRWHRMASGLVVYSNDSLQQFIDVRIFGAMPSADPAEWRSGKAWTQTEMADACFPSRRLTLSSPSKAGTESCGPSFRVDATSMAVRIQWMEFQGSRDDSKPLVPDVIRLDLWPA
jgi:hypothetical protein